MLLGFLRELLHSRRDEVCRSAGDSLLVADDLLYDIRVHRLYGLAILAADKILGLLGADFVSLAEKNIHDSLRTDDL